MITITRRSGFARSSGKGASIHELELLLCEHAPLGFASGDANLRRIVGNNPTNITDPSGLLADVKPSDEAFEAIINHDEKTMPFDKMYAIKVSGKTIDGDTLTFSFEKAAFGKRYDKLVMKTVVGAYVKIVVSLQSKKYDELRLIQVYQDFTIENEKMIAILPDVENRRQRAGWILDKNEWKMPATAKSPGWLVDSLEASRDTYWITETECFHIMGRNENPVSTYWDAPGNFAPVKSRGKVFLTAVIGIKGKKQVFLGAVRWGYYTNDKGDATPLKSPKFEEKAPPELGDALSRWNKWWIDRLKFGKLKQGVHLTDPIMGITIE